MGGATDFLGDVGDWLHEGAEDVIGVGEKAVDIPGQFVKDPLGTISRGVRGVGELALVGPKWIGDAGEWLGKRTGISPLENIGDTVGDVARDKRLEGLAGAVTMAYAAPYLFGPLAEGMSGAAWGAGEAAAAGQELTLAQWLASNMPNSMFNYMIEAAAADPLISAGKTFGKEGLKLGMQEGINKYILEPAMEKYLEAMKKAQELSGSVPQLRNYSYNPAQVAAPQMAAFGPTGPVLQNAPFTFGMPTSTNAGLMSDYLKEYTDYSKLFSDPISFLSE